MKIFRCLAYTALTTVILAVYVVVPLAVTLRPFLGGLAISLVASLGGLAIGVTLVVSILCRTGPSVRDGLEPHTVPATVPQHERDILDHRLADSAELHQGGLVTAGMSAEMNVET
jgi:hypothetical protein